MPNRTNDHKKLINKLVFKPLCHCIWVRTHACNMLLSYMFAVLLKSWRNIIYILVDFWNERNFFVFGGFTIPDLQHVIKKRDIKVNDLQTSKKKFFKWASSQSQNNISSTLKMRSPRKTAKNLIEPWPYSNTD